MYKNFRLNILLRVACIVALAIGIAYITTTKPSLFMPVALVILLIVAVINLIAYIEKSNKDLTRFLLSLRQGAFMESFSSGSRGKPFEEFSGAMNEILREFAKVNEEKELHYQYLQTLNEKINVAIFSFEANGNLIQMNPAAKQLINYPHFSTISDFRKVDLRLGEAIESIEPEDRRVTKAFVGEDLYQLSIQCKEIILKGKPIRLILLQNLNNELETKEIEAWQQLIRVLTHEIMNSVTPIVSLTDAMRKILTDSTGKPKDTQRLEDENFSDIHSSVETIHSRSKGLLRFVNTYKEFAKSIEMRAQPLNVIDLILRVQSLVQPEFDARKIKFRFVKKADQIIVRTDAALMEHVMINLLKNAIDAVTHDGSGVITLYAEKTSHQQARITVEDNGPGIEPDVIDKIFIPFYTTKKHGTGIGLSLSRQILKLHDGNIRVFSTLHKGTSFVVEWK